VKFNPDYAHGLVWIDHPPFIYFLPPLR